MDHPIDDVLLGVAFIIVVLFLHGYLKRKAVKSNIDRLLEEDF